MRTEDFGYAVAVAEDGDLTRAAARLAIDPAEVRAGLTRLAADLGADLIVGDGPSPALIRLAEPARDVLAAVARTREAARGLTAIRIGAGYPLGARAAELADRLEPSRVELSEVAADDGIAAVRSGRLDAVVLRGVSEVAGLDLVPVWEHTLVVALPADHPAAELDEVSVLDLLDLPLRMPAATVDPALVELVEQACRRSGFMPEPGVALAPEAGLEQLGSASWTVLYADSPLFADGAPEPVAVRPLLPALVVAGVLGTRPGSPLADGLRAANPVDSAVPAPGQ